MKREGDNVAAALDYVVILVVVSAVGAFLFLASALIFLVEEIAKYLVRLVGESACHLYEWASRRAKVPPPVPSTIPGAKP